MRSRRESHSRQRTQAVRKTPQVWGGTAGGQHATQMGQNGGSTDRPPPRIHVRPILVHERNKLVTTRGKVCRHHPSASLACNVEHAHPTLKEVPWYQEMQLRVPPRFQFTQHTLQVGRDIHFTGQGPVDLHTHRTPVFAIQLDELQGWLFKLNITEQRRCTVVGHAVCLWAASLGTPNRGGNFHERFGFFLFWCALCAHNISFVAMQRTKAWAEVIVSLALTSLQSQEALAALIPDHLPVDVLEDADLGTWVHVLLGNPDLWRCLMASQVDDSTALLLTECDRAARRCTGAPEAFLTFMSCLGCFANAKAYLGFVTALCRLDMPLGLADPLSVWWVRSLPLLINFLAQSLADIGASVHGAEPRLPGPTKAWAKTYKAAMTAFRRVCCKAEKWAVCDVGDIHLLDVWTCVSTSLLRLHRAVPKESASWVVWEVAQVRFLERLQVMLDGAGIGTRQKQYLLSGFVNTVDWSQRPKLLAALCRENLHPCLAHRPLSDPTFLAFCNWYKLRPNPACLLHELTACSAWEPLVWEVDALLLTVLYIGRSGDSVVVGNSRYLHWMVHVLSSPSKGAKAPGIIRAMDDTLVGLAKLSFSEPQAAADFAKLMGPAVFACDCAAAGDRIFHYAPCVVAAPTSSLSTVHGDDVASLTPSSALLEVLLPMPVFAAVFLHCYWIGGAAPPSVVACLLPAMGVPLCTQSTVVTASSGGDCADVEAVLEIVSGFRERPGWRALTPDILRQFVVNMLKALEQPANMLASQVIKMLSVATAFLLFLNPGQPIAVPLQETETLLATLARQQPDFFPVLLQVLSRRLLEDPTSLDWAALARMIALCPEESLELFILLMAEGMGLRADVVMDQFAGHERAQALWGKWVLDRWPGWACEMCSCGEEPCTVKDLGTMQASVMHLARGYPEHILGHRVAHEFLKTFKSSLWSCRVLTLCVRAMDATWLAWLRQRLPQQPGCPVMSALRDAIAARGCA